MATTNARNLQSHAPNRYTSTAARHVPGGLHLPVDDDINELRNMNEHVLEYFQDKGRFQHEFIYATDQAIADASSTIEDRIGNRLSWKDVSDIMERLLHQLPGAAQTHATKSTL